MIQDRQLIVSVTATHIFPPKPAPKIPAGVEAMSALIAKGHSPEKAMQMLESKNHKGKVPETKFERVPTIAKRRPNLKTTSARSVILGMLGDTPAKIGKPLAIAAGLSVDTIYRAIADLKSVGQIISGPYDNGKPTYSLTDAGRIERQRRLGESGASIDYTQPADARAVVLSMASEIFAVLDHGAIAAAGVSQTAGYNAVTNLVRCGHLERGARTGNVWTYRLTEAGKAERLRRFGA